MAVDQSSELEHPRTIEQLQKLRVEMLAFGAGHGVKNFTCDDCPALSICKHAYDLYNTDGDCLAEK